MADIKSPVDNSPDVGYTSVWDSRPVKYKSVLFQVSSFILMMELSERLSYYGINQGLKNFMQKIGWSVVSSSAIKSTWTSLCYLTPIFGAYLADEKWGRWRVILIFGIWYCIGDFLVAIAAYPDIMDNQSVCTPIFVIGLFLGIGVGTGAIKSNVITFGADQFNPHDENEVKQKETFFSYFYFAINFGAIFSYAYLSSLCVNGSPQIPAEYGYFATYLICSAVFGIAILIFLIGTPRYVHMPPVDKCISTFFKVSWYVSQQSTSGKIFVYGTMSYIIAFIMNIITAFLAEDESTSEALSYVCFALVLIGMVSWVKSGMDPSFFNVASAEYGGIYDPNKIEGYKALLRCLPYAAFTIIWQCAYDQTDANFQSITQQCDLRWDTSKPDNSQVPGAALGVFDPIIIVIFIPILDSIIYPTYAKFAKKPASKFGRTITGLLVSIIGLFWAGAFEIIRRNAGLLTQANGEPILDDGSNQPMNDISWAAAIPNYVFIGMAECLINVTAYDVFYSYVPQGLKSIAQAMNLFMLSMGSIMTSTFTIMFSKYIPTDNLNDANLEYMFFTIGAISIVNLACFMWVMLKMDFGLSSSEPVDPTQDEPAGLEKMSYISVSRHSVADGKQ